MVAVKRAAVRYTDGADAYKADMEFCVPLNGERVNAATLAAMAEVREMEKDASLGKSYSDVDDMMADILG